MEELRLSEDISNADMMYDSVWRPDLASVNMSFRQFMACTCGSSISKSVMLWVAGSRDNS
jgi:hypothetical protein